MEQITTIFFVLSGVLALVIGFFYFKRDRRPLSFGLGEGPETSLELESNDNLRETYSNFKEKIMEVLSLKFDNIKVIAAGGMGIIASADEKANGRKVAIKTIAPRLQENPKAIRFFLQEVQAIQRMNHPNIIRIFDMVSDGLMYYTMEFLDGESLEQIMEKTGILPTEQIVRIGTHVARALQHCHTNGVVHRDIKPSNIFVTRSDQTSKIIDFGIVQLVNQGSTEYYGGMGTPYYASPEQIKGGEVTGKSDIYGLGVCLFKMATTKYPFPEPLSEGQGPQEMEDLAKLNPNLPSDLVRILHDCLKIDEEERVPAYKLWMDFKKVTL